MQAYEEAIRLLNRMCIPVKQEPFFVEFLWFQHQLVTKHGIRISKQFHQHTFYEVHLAYVGHATYTLQDGTKLTIGPGEYLLFPPGIDHCFYTCSTDYERFAIAFSASDKELAEQGISMPAEPLCRPLTEEMMHALLLSSAAVLQGDSLAPLVLRESLFLFILLLAEKNGPVAIDPRLEDSRLARAKRFIADNRMRALTVSEVASYVHLSARQFTRLFIAAEGIAPLQYIRRERCAAAKEMLLSSGDLLAVIAEKMGFSCEYNFIRFFKSVEGVTPAHFRRIAQVKGAEREIKKDKEDRP